MATVEVEVAQLKKEISRLEERLERLEMLDKRLWRAEKPRCVIPPVKPTQECSIKPKGKDNA